MLSQISSVCDLMTVETVKATYDPQAKAIYVKLSDKAVITRSVTSFDNEVQYDIGRDGEIVGIEVILS